MACGPHKDRKRDHWYPHLVGDLKFNVDGAPREKPGSAGIGGVLCNDESHIMLSFSNFVGVKDSNAEF